MRVRNKDHDICDLLKYSMHTSFDFEQDAINERWIDQWRDHLRSCVRAGGRYFEHMLWNERSFIWWFIGTSYEIVNVIWCI